MIDRTFTVVPEKGLHARPAAQFVSTADQFDSTVTVAREDDDETVDASSMLAVTGLNIRSGERVRVTADGPDEQEALDILEEIVTTPENEQPA